MKKLNYAIIGCGRISANHIAAAIANDMNIVALCDVDAKKMTSLKELFPINDSREYVDYLEMIKKENIDLVSICTESGYHGEIALRCLDYDVNLIIEKPITLSLEEARKIISIANEKKVVVSTCHQNRFNKSIVKLKESIDQNRFGRLFYGTAHIRWNRNKSYYDAAPWRGTWALDGGSLMNQCIHNIDLLRWMMGTKIKEVIAFTDNQNHSYIEAEDFGIAMVRFENGSYGLIEGTTNIYPKNLEETLYIFGETGTVKIGGRSVNKIEEWNFANILEDDKNVKQKFSENPPNVYGFGHTPLYEDVKNAILTNTEPKVTAKDGLEALELVLAIYESSSKGKIIKLPLENVKSTDFDGQFDSKE